MEIVEDTCLLIRRFPLEPIVGGLRVALRQAFQPSPLQSQQKTRSDELLVKSSDPGLKEVESKEDEARETISSLIVALQTHRVAKKLPAIDGNKKRNLTSADVKGTVAGELATLYGRLDSNQIDTQIFKPLVSAICKKLTDVEIWKSVLQLVDSVFRTTPPVSRSASVSTPFTHSSASIQGPEATRKRVEDLVFDEIRDCTHFAVGGFHEKYFQNKSWSKKVDELWQSAKKSYNQHDEIWRSLSQNPEEDEVSDWLLELQKELLPGNQTAYFRSTMSTKVGTDNKRQIDLFVKSSEQDAASNDSKHSYHDVLVLGELKKSEEHSKALLLQVGSIVRNVFADQPTRYFVHAFTLTGTELQCWVFDRSGPFSAEIINIHKQPKKFIEVIFGYLFMDEEELGLNTILEEQSGRTFLTLPSDAPRGRKRKFELDSMPIAYQRAIVCRGTTCYLAKRPRKQEYDNVIKFSWASNMRLPEMELLKKANDRGVKGLAKLVAYQDNVTSISSLRKGLVFSAPHKFRNVARNGHSSISRTQSSTDVSFRQFPGLSIASNGNGKRKSIDIESRISKRYRSNSQVDDKNSGDNVAYPVQTPKGTSLAAQESEPYANRILRILAITPAGRSISQFTSPIQIVESLCDAIRAHRSLYINGKILHRDISENNIIITNPSTIDGFKGMLIDLDLAKEVGQGPSGARHRTGTMEFMAIEVLQGISHTYRHDLEAFFYVLIWLCARRGWDAVQRTKERPRSSMLPRWYSGTYDAIAQNKRGDMDKQGLECILREFPAEFEAIKSLCRKVRDILFPYRDGLFTGTPDDPELLYGPILKAFSDNILILKED